MPIFVNRSWLDEILYLQVPSFLRRQTVRYLRENSSRKNRVAQAHGSCGEVSLNVRFLVGGKRPWSGTAEAAMLVFNARTKSQSKCNNGNSCVLRPLCDESLALLVFFHSRQVVLFTRLCVQQMLSLQGSHQEAVGSGPDEATRQHEGGFIRSQTSGSC